MDDMNPMEAEVDLENHRHEDEFSAACELHDIRGCRRCAEYLVCMLVKGQFTKERPLSNESVILADTNYGGFVETNDGDVDQVPPMEGIEYVSPLAGMFDESNGNLGASSFTPMGVQALSPTDKLLILLDDSISLKERLERTGERRSTILRRTERCECGHTKFWHMSDGKCMCDIHRQGGITLDVAFTCPCVEYLPQADRRSK